MLLNHGRRKRPPFDGACSAGASIISIRVCLKNNDEPLRDDLAVLGPLDTVAVDNLREVRQTVMKLRPTR